MPNEAQQQTTTRVTHIAGQCGRQVAGKLANVASAELNVRHLPLKLNNLGVPMAVFFDLANDTSRCGGFAAMVGGRLSRVSLWIWQPE